MTTLNAGFESNVTPVSWEEVRQLREESNYQISHSMIDGKMSLYLNVFFVQKERRAQFTANALATLEREIAVQFRQVDELLEHDREAAMRARAPVDTLGSTAASV